MIVDDLLSIRRMRIFAFFILWSAFFFCAAVQRAAASESVELTWTLSPDPNVIGYNIHFGTESQFYTDEISYGVTNDVVIPGLQEGVTYYFVVTAMDNQGDESVFSNEATYTVPISSSQSLWAQLTAPQSQSVALTWTPSPDINVYGYQVYYWNPNDGFTNEVEVDGTTNKVIPELEGGATYYFAVAPIDYYGTGTNLSNEVSVAVPGSVPLTLQAQADPLAWQAVNLTWSASPNSDVYGYLIYYWNPDSGYTNQMEFDGTTSATLSPYLTPGLNYGMTYDFAVAAIGTNVNGVAIAQTNLSTPVTYVVPTSGPILLQLEPTADANGQVYQMQITTSSAVNGYWKLECSTDLHNWQYYANGLGWGIGNGFDINQTVPVDPTKPQMFFRAYSQPLSLQLPAVLQTQTFTDGNGQLQMQINTFTVVNGPWQIQSSTDLQNWEYYTDGYGYGNGDGNDINVIVPVDPTQPQKFFRVNPN